MHYAEASQSSQHSSEISSSSADTALPKEPSGTKKTIVSPLHLPSGPLINLTKVAAQHKKNQMSYTSLVAKHAAMEKVKRKKATPKTPPTAGTPTTQMKKTAAPPTRQPAKPTFSIIRRREIELTRKTVDATYFAGGESVRNFYPINLVFMCI